MGTTADKLQKLVNGKQYVIDKTNTKAGSDLKINSTWKSIGDTIEAITTGGGGTDITDATATASDIRIGKTAYISSGKVEGTIEDYDGAYDGEAEKVSGVVEVNELPTENVQEKTLYETKKYLNTNLLVHLGGGDYFTFTELVSPTAPNAIIEYFVVNNLPAEGKISDVLTYSCFYIYFYNDIAYIYTNIGNGNTWIEIKELLNPVLSDGFGVEISLDNKGYILSDRLESDYENIEAGYYVEYNQILGIKNDGKQYIYFYDCGWNDYKSVFEKTVKTFSNEKYIKLYGGEFYQCNDLEEVNLPNLEEMLGRDTFSWCTKLKTVKIPKIRSILSANFQYCMRLEHLNIHETEYIAYDAFFSCNSLKALIIEKPDAICTLKSTSAFTACSHILGETHSTYNPNGDKDGYIYVPDSLVESYKVAENWSTFASQIKPLSELPQEYKELYGI